jgi:hypothetical protein
MACSSVNCASYCYSYGCGSIHRGARPSYSYPFPDVGVESNAAFTNALRSAVASELAARQVGRGVASANVVTGTHDVAVVNGVQVLTDLRDCINAMVYCIGTDNYPLTSSSIYVTRMFFRCLLSYRAPRC